MKRSIFQFCSLLRLSACFFALVCLSSVGYAASGADNVHVCLPFESEDEHDGQYVARKRGVLRSCLTSHQRPILMAMGLLVLAIFCCLQPSSD